MSERIESIKRMLEESPDDVFLHYSLGMEYASGGHYDEAAEEFNRCVELDDGYLAAYVEAGKALRSAGRLGEAREVFLSARELASVQGELHMRDYIQQQIDALGPGS